jgi:hypothetical protein
MDRGTRVSSSAFRADTAVVEAVKEAQDAWLFKRGTQSIYVKRLPMGMTLLVCGPGYDEHSHHFQGEESLNEFWRWYKRHLLSEEWVLTPDRRSPDRADRPSSGPERRRRPREVSTVR